MRDIALLKTIFKLFFLLHVSLMRFIVCNITSNDSQQMAYNSVCVSCNKHETSCALRIQFVIRLENEFGNSTTIIMLFDFKAYRIKCTHNFRCIISDAPFCATKCTRALMSLFVSISTAFIFCLHFTTKNEKIF